MVCVVPFWSKFAGRLLLVALLCSSAICQEEDSVASLSRSSKPSIGARRLLQDAATFSSPQEDSPESAEDFDASAGDTLTDVASSASVSHTEIDQMLLELLERAGVPAKMAEPGEDGVFETLATVASASALSHASIDAALLEAQAPGPGGPEVLNPQLNAPPGVLIAAIAGASDLSHSTIDAALAASAPEGATTLAQIAAASEDSHSGIDQVLGAVRTTAPPAPPGEAPAPVAILEPHELLVAIRNLTDGKAAQGQSADQAIIGSQPPAPSEREGAEELPEEKDGATEMAGVTDNLSTIAGGSALSHASIDQALLAALAPDANEPETEQEVQAAKEIKKLSSGTQDAADSEAALEEAQAENVEGMAGATDTLSDIAGGSALSHASIDQALLAALASPPPSDSSEGVPIAIADAEEGKEEEGEEAAEEEATESALRAFRRPFVVSPASFVYDRLHDLYFYVSRGETRPLHEGGDRGNNNGDLSAFRPNSVENLFNPDPGGHQNFGFCEEAHGTEIVGELLYVAAMGQVCVFNTTTFEQLDSIGCCGESSAFDGHFLQGIAYDPVRNMLWVTDLGAREQEVHNTGDDSDEDAGVTLDLNGKEMIAAIDLKAYNDDGTPQIRKTLGFSSTDSDSDSFSRTGEDPLDRTVRFHPAGLAVDPTTGLIFVANTIVKAQEDDEGENKYASVWWCLPLGEAPCGSAECEGGFSETFDRTVSCNELQATRPVYHAGFNADGLVFDTNTKHVIFTAWPSNVQSHQQGDDSDGYKDSHHLDQPGKVFRVVGSARKSVQYLTDGQGELLVAHLAAGVGCASSACDTVSAVVALERGRDDNSLLKLTYRVTGAEKNVDTGIHVHEGTSCFQPAGLYSSKNPNAWFGVKYQTDEHGNGEGAFEIDTGFSLEENSGHAVTIHDRKGTALACGILGPGPNKVPLIQPGDLTIDTKRNQLVIPSKDKFNTNSNTYYTVHLATATWAGWPVQTLQTVTQNIPGATVKEFSTSWLNTPNMITYDARNDRYITSLGSFNRIERKIKIREPDSPFEENGQLSAWSAETNVLVADLFGGCPQAWDSVVVDDLMYTASFMGWVCVMNLTDFNNGPNIGEKFLLGHNINGIAYDKKRNVLWVTEDGTQGGNERITHTLPSLPKDTHTAMIVAIDLATREVVAQTNVSNQNFFPVSLAVDPASGNLIVGNTVAKIRSSDFGALVECIPDAGLFVTCYGIPTTNTVSATNQIVLGVEIANDGLIYFSAMKPLNQIDPEANLFRLNEDRQLETLVLDLFLACRIEGNPKRRKNAPPAPDAEDVAAVNKFGVNETEGNDSDRWMGFGEESDTDSDGANPDSDKDDDDVDPCLLAQIPSHASFSYDPKRNQLVFPTIEDNTKFTVDLDTAKWIYYRPPTPKREMDLEELAALPGAGALDTDNDISEDSNDHGVDIRERDRDVDSDAWDSDDDKREAEEKEKALQLQREAEIASGVYTAETEAVVERADEDSNEESSEKKEGEEGEDHDERESEDLVEDLLDFKFDKSEVFVPTRVEASVAQLAPFPFAVHSGLVNRTARGVVKLVAGFNKTLVVTYQLVDLDPASRPADPDAAGHLAIHAGLSCDHIGRQLFTQPPNVIESQRLSYHADNLGQASDSISVQTGVSYEDNVGRAFVVYAAGMPPQKPILCGILAPTENSKAYLAPVLEGNDDPFKGTLRGNVTLTPVINPQLGESPIRLAWNVTGAAPNTVGHIHVHDASTCEGIHLLGPDSILQKSADDAEGAAATAFETDAQGQAHGSLEVNSGFGYAANAGKAVTLHDDKDATVACGVLVPQTVQVPCPICILPLDFRLDENSVNDFDRDGESDSPCIDRDTDDSDCQTVDELREEDSDDFNESDEGRTDDDNHNEKRIPDSGWYMVTVFAVVAILIAVFVKRVFVDAPEEGAGAEQHALLSKVNASPADEETPGGKATDSVV